MQVHKGKGGSTMKKNLGKKNWMFPMPAAVVFLAFHHAIKHTDKYRRCKEDAI
jgi:hypothetical protein